jgi:hypothetical protein
MFALVVVATIVVVVVAVALASRRYGERERPDPGWRRTDEVFVDPSTDRTMRVWIDPTDGSRHYVPEGRRPGPPDR